MIAKNIIIIPLKDIRNPCHKGILPSIPATPNTVVHKPIKNINII
jgi:hypothetical protein